MGLVSSLILGGIATASGISAGSKAKAQKAQAEYHAGVARTNAEIAEQNVQDIAKRGRVAAYEKQRSTAAAIGATRAAAAGAGLVVDAEGTVTAEAVQAMAEAGELDILRIRNNVEREQRRAAIQGAQFEAQAGLFDFQADAINPVGIGLMTSLTQLAQFAMAAGAGQGGGKGSSSSGGSS